MTFHQKLNLIATAVLICIAVPLLIVSLVNGDTTFIIGSILFLAVAAILIPNIRAKKKA